MFVWVDGQGYDGDIIGVFTNELDAQIAFELQHSSFVMKIPLDKLCEAGW